MNSIWQMWERGITPTTCNRIVEECQKLQPMEANIGSDSKTNTVNTDIRRSEVRWAGHIEWLNKLVYDFATRANRQAFGFDISWK